MFKRLYLTVLFVLMVCLNASAQISVPNTLVAGTTIRAADLNTNFTYIADRACNRTGCTLTATINVQAILPTTDATYTLGDATHRFTTGSFSGTVTAGTFSGSGASLTALPAANLTGTIASAVQDLITRTGTLVSGATGAGFTVALSTSTITGTLADARLSSNVPLLNVANTFTAFGLHQFVAGSVGDNHLYVQNSSAGTGNGAKVSAASDAATISLQAFASTYTTAGAFRADSGLLMADSDASGGLGIMARHASGAIRFYTGGNAETMSLSSAGLLTVTNSISGGVGALLGNAHSAGYGVKVIGASDATRYALTVNTYNDATVLLQVLGSGLLTVPANSDHVFGTQADASTATNSIRLYGGGSGTSGGSFVQFTRGTTGTGHIGSRSAIIGSTNPNALVVYGQHADGLEHVAANASGAIRFYTGGTTQRFAIDANGNWLNGSNIMDSTGTPVCTSGCTFGAGRDYAFYVTAITSGAVVTFGRAWSTAPICVLTDGTTSVSRDVYVANTTTTTLTIYSIDSSLDRANVICRSY